MVTLLKTNCSKNESFLMGDLKDKLKNKDRIKETENSTKLFPLININCLMNTEIKQQHHIWDTNFGKRLINEDNDNRFMKSKFDDTSKDVPANNTENIKDFSTNQPNKSPSKQKYIMQQNAKIAGGDSAADNIQGKIKKKQFQKINKINQTLSKKFCQEKSVTNSFKINEKKSSAKINKVPSKKKLEKALTKKKNPISEQADIMEVPSTVSCFTEKRHFLTECVRNILDDSSSQIECEHCKEHFSVVEELCHHKRIVHFETKKEICLLCEKVFYNRNEFIQHLLSHKDVDRFSCKKCKKYFLNLKKYKQHCQDFHFEHEKILSCQDQESVKYVKTWLPKYECKRCEIELDSKKTQEEHRRYHIKMDLAGIYLLGPKNF